MTLDMTIGFICNSFLCADCPICDGRCPKFYDYDADVLQEKLYKWVDSLDGKLDSNLETRLYMCGRTPQEFLDAIGYAGGVLWV